MAVGSCQCERRSVEIARIMIAAGHQVPNGTPLILPVNHGSCGAMSNIDGGQKIST